MSDTFESMPNYKILNCCYNCEYFDNFYCSKHEKMLCISHGICSSYKERKSYINNHPDSNDEKSSLDSNTFVYILEERKGMIMSNTS